MEENSQLALAFQFLETTGVNLFLTGKAGTGKTTFLQNYRIRASKRIVVLAPTGVAAINARGVTIHSFFQLPFTPWIPVRSTQERFQHRFSRDKINLIRSVDLLVIDEISMVRADVLDAVDEVLRKYRDRSKPFGGVQLLLIGDMQQLSPVVTDDEWNILREYYPTPYFFDSLALKSSRYVTVELTQVYRQHDAAFLDILNSVREKQLTPHVLEQLNERYVPGFVPDERYGYIRLTTHNQQARTVNERELQRLDTPSYVYHAHIADNFPEYSYPVDAELHLKVGAQVMFMKNDPMPEKHYYNGKIATVTALDDDHIEVTCKDDGRVIEVPPLKWENVRYGVDDRTGEVTEAVDGTFTQYPLKTAWAITIHKSQGLTFDRVMIDARDAFAHGQVYVALSRCRTLQGILLSEPISSQSLVGDGCIDRFSQQIARQQPDPDTLKLEQREYRQNLLLELFDFDPLYHAMGRFVGLFYENLGTTYPEYEQQWHQICTRFHDQAVSVSRKFRVQLSRLFTLPESSENQEYIHERTIKAVPYFREILDALDPLFTTELPDTDNKEIRKIIERSFERLVEAYQIKRAVLESCVENFDPTVYLRSRSGAMLEPSRVRKKRSSAAKLKSPEASEMTSNELYEALRNWRKLKAEELRVPVYQVLHQKALLGIAKFCPDETQALAEIEGIGKTTLKKYGAELLEIVREYNA